MTRNTIFDVDNKKDNIPNYDKKNIHINIDNDFKEKLNTIFNEKIDYLTQRLEVVFSENEIDKIKENVKDMFNFHISKFSSNKLFDISTSKKIVIPIKRKNNKIIVQNYNNVSHLFSDFKSFIEFRKNIKEQIFSDYATTVKYCILGMTGEKRRIDIDEE